MATLLPNALTTLADVKETLGIASSDTTRDNLIIRQINSATETIEKYTGRKFMLTTYTNEEYDATNTDQLILKHNPVTTFTTLEVRDTALNMSDWETVDSELYFVDYSAGVLDLIFHATGRWNRYRATYSAGYATIPSDIQEACVSLAAFNVANPSVDAQVRKKQEGSRSIEYFDTSNSKSSIFDQLGLLDVLNSYCDMPILADK